MPEFDVLAGQCDPDPSCPKVLRIGLGDLVVVGTAEPDSAPDTVSITGSLYGSALAAVEPQAERPCSREHVTITGEPVTDPALLLAYGVGPGEGAVRVGEAAYQAVGAAIGAGA